ncbi:hypothetical protein PHLCEN_2v8450 [Hermanssonia centrifuga]|uniref:Uncharacterized protein n=1 Tax=Hermanssonia centrifuga TaxID=98765 RepID=A0A2R6NTK3_9APHY|nr:hypothetical protein PHLCEN_2v8450 [Hermanssonia centrifuga]
MATYTLTVMTSTDDCPRLRQAGYRLFLAKQINGNYEVIWFGDPWLVNRFQWQSGLEVFESLTFEGGLQVDAKTTAHNIKFGEIVTLGQWDHGKPATGASDQSEALSGNVDLTPVEKMLVWFDFKSHIGTVLANEIPYSVEKPPAPQSHPD